MSDPPPPEQTQVPQTPPVPQPEAAPSPPGLVDELLGRNRVLLMLGVFAVELAVFVAGLVTPLDPSTQQSIANQTSSQFSFVQSATAVQLVFFIFFHNLAIALLELIPVFGAGFFLLSIYTTGLATQAIVASHNLPGLSGLVLFALPYTFVELSGYALAVGAGTMLLISILRRRLVQELRVFAVEGVLVAVVLIVAASMETATSFSVLVGFALWVPTGLAVAGVILVWSRRRH